MGFWYRIKIRIFFIVCIIVEVTKNVFAIRRKCSTNTNLTDKVVVITGGSDGIGKETCLQLSLRDAKVIIGCRDLEKAETAVQDMRQKNPTANIRVLKLDLSSLKSVRLFTESVQKIESKIDILINNAGIMWCPEKQTEDGFELHLQTNHLGHFLLTLLLVPLMKRAPKARVITVSSILHIVGQINFENLNLRHIYGQNKAYSQSKLANVLFTRELAKRLGPQSSIKTYCLHPGIIRSNLFRHKTTLLMKFFHKFLTINVEFGAQTTLYCTLEESIENETGFYYDDCKRTDPKWMTSTATDDKSAKLLWQMSCDLVKLEDNLQLNSN